MIPEENLDFRYKRDKAETKKTFICKGCKRSFQWTPIIPNKFFPDDLFCSKICKGNTLRHYSTDKELLDKIITKEQAEKAKEFKLYNFYRQLKTVFCFVDKPDLDKLCNKCYGFQMCQCLYLSLSVYLYDKSMNYEGIGCL